MSRLPATWALAVQLAEHVSPWVQRYANAIIVTGYASPEGDENHNDTLAQDRANAVATYLREQMPGILFTTWNGGTLDGDPKDYPTFRRAEVKR